MEAINTTNMTIDPKPMSIEEQLSQLFGSYKAEWLRERMFDLFSEPDILSRAHDTEALCVSRGAWHRKDHSTALHVI